MNELAVMLFDYRGKSGRMSFLIAEVVRLIALAACYGLYRTNWIVPAAILAPAALWPGIVGTIKRFRDLGHDPLLILPVLMYLAGGFASGIALGVPYIGLATLGIYLIYVLGAPGTQTNRGNQHDNA